MLDPTLVKDIIAILVESDIDRKLREAMRLSTRAQSRPIEITGVRSGHPTIHSDPVHGVSCAHSDPVRRGTSSVHPDPVQRASTSVNRPGRPASWTILAPRELSDRPKLGSQRGRYLLLHSVAHIELSAVELALMAVADFPEQPAEYHRAMLDIAREEVIHTRMLLRRLRELGGELGTDPVHFALFETARALEIAGTFWFRAGRAERELDGEAYFLTMVEKFRPRRGGIGPIDHAGRRAAGFSERELEALSNE